MALGHLRFCPKCLATRNATADEVCATCALELLPLNDSAGALSCEFLSARGSCCGSGCRNCPFPGDAVQKVCPRCSGSFDCRADADACWCAGVRVSRATLDQLRQSYPDCLCPSCLIELAEATAPSESRM